MWHCRLVIVGVFLLGLAGSVQAQQWSWPEQPENLQVLPKDWTGQRLSPVMRGFTRALGVRCSYCHVGEEGQPLSTYDFASDDNPNKDRAREMLRMLGSINDHLDKIEPSSEPRVNMWCHTCHRGRPRPMTLEEELTEVYRAGGIESALAAYWDLRAEYYGKGAYSFTEDPLNSFGYTLLGEDNTAGALLVFQLNAAQFPQSANVWDSLAEGYMKTGNMKLAEQYYARSLALNPNNRNAVNMLEQIRTGQPEQ